ncbi:MAG TPA: hypothetical protein VIG24_13475 [Acidimicrobiia bacterium]
MPAVSVAGAAFTVEVDTTPYTSQVTTGTITTTPTITRTKTLDSVAFDQTDLNSTMSIDFLYDEESGLYGALQTAIANADTIAVTVQSATGEWSGATMSIEDLEASFDATGIATASLSLTGPVTFAAQA